MFLIWSGLFTLQEYSVTELNFHPLGDRSFCVGEFGSLVWHLVWCMHLFDAFVQPVQSCQFMCQLVGILYGACILMMHLSEFVR